MRPVGYDTTELYRGAEAATTTHEKRVLAFLVSHEWYPEKRVRELQCAVRSSLMHVSEPT